VVQEEQQAEEAAAFEARQPTKRDVSVRLALLTA
jgi:hypothetical protein